MSDLVLLNGLWIHEREVRRFSEYPVFEGRLDIDARKNMRATKFCTSRRRALDIGAHIGSVTRMLAGRFEAVDSFEAIPDTFGLLKKNTEGLDNVAIHNIAVSDREGEQKFEYLARHSQLSHALKDGESPSLLSKGKKQSTIIGPIAAKPIDSFGFDDVSYVKIDVEGSELDVVRGMRETLLRCKPIVLIEQAANEVQFHGGKKNEASDYLRELGMKMQTAFRAKKDRVFYFEK